MFYISAVWDPRLIIAQIFTMQTFYYLFMGVVLWILDLLSGNIESIMDQMFLFKLMEFTSLVGGLTIIASFLTSIAGSFFLIYIVERSKKCLDFTATVYILHAIACIIYSKQFPNSWTWWGINLLSLVIMAVLGEYLCMRRELRAIPLKSANIANLISTNV